MPLRGGAVWFRTASRTLVGCWGRSHTHKSYTHTHSYTHTQSYTHIVSATCTAMWPHDIQDTFPASLLPLPVLCFGCFCPWLVDVFSVCFMYVLCMFYVSPWPLFVIRCYCMRTEVLYRSFTLSSVHPHPHYRSTVLTRCCLFVTLCIINNGFFNCPTLRQHFFMKKNV